MSSDRVDNRPRYKKKRWIGLAAFLLIGGIGAATDDPAPTDTVATAPVNASVVPPASPTRSASPSPSPTLVPAEVQASADAAVAAASAEAKRVADEQAAAAAAAAAAIESRRVADAQAAETKRVADAQAAAEATRQTAASDTSTTNSGGSTYYANCDAVRAAGAAPIRVGDPGYSRKLDRDGDGQGCAGD